MIEGSIFLPCNVKVNNVGCLHMAQYASNPNPGTYCISGEKMADTERENIWKRTEGTRQHRDNLWRPC